VAFADHRQAASEVDQQHDQIEQTHSASVYELGFDLIQPFSSRVHSTGVLFIRTAAADPITAVADRFKAAAAAAAAAEGHQLNAATQEYVDYLNRSRRPSDGGCAGRQLRRNRHGGTGSVVYTSTCTAEAAGAQAVLLCHGLLFW
jgi:hypothetical protein